MRGQLSIDLMFAVLMIIVTITNLTYLATTEISHSEELDVLTNVKIFSISLSDHVSKVYATGRGYKIKEIAPNLDGGSIRVIFNGTENTITVNASVNGRSFWIVRNSTVPLYTSNVTLSSEEEFWLVAYYDENEGMLYVKVEG
jgi:hypothetical protein